MLSFSLFGIMRQTWEDSKAVFMRNWPYVYGVAKKNTHVQAFMIHSMPYGGKNTLGHSSIGGWQLAVNALIDSDRKAAAWKFIQYLLGPEAQKTAASQAS